MECDNCSNTTELLAQAVNRTQNVQIEYYEKVKELTESSRTLSEQVKYLLEYSEELEAKNKKLKKIIQKNAFDLHADTNDTSDDETDQEVDEKDVDEEADEETDEKADEKADDYEPEQLTETFAIVTMALMDISVNDDWRPLQSEFKGKANNLVTVVEEDVGKITNDIIIEKLETAQKGNNVFLVNAYNTGFLIKQYMELNNISRHTTGIRICKDKVGFSRGHGHYCYCFAEVISKYNAYAFLFRCKATWTKVITSCLRKSKGQGSPSYLELVLKTWADGEI